MKKENTPRSSSKCSASFTFNVILFTQLKAIFLRFSLLFPINSSSILFHKATKKAPRVISVPLMSGVLHCFNVAFRALLRITLQPFALHSKRAVVHSKESSATSKESSGAFPYLLLSVQLVVDTKKEDERIDNAEQIDHCESNEAAQQHPAVV